MDANIDDASGETGCGERTGVRLVVLNLPEDEGEGLGFRLTRTLWDPYPWVREVKPETRADLAGLKTGDCLLQADGRDLLGMPVGQVAGLIRGDGTGGGVSLLVWNCGVDPKDDPEADLVRVAVHPDEHDLRNAAKAVKRCYALLNELPLNLLWSCGGGSRGEKSRRALAGVLKALSCCVCAATATKALTCARSHLYCEACWTRLERCALCRENLPSKDSPYSRNLIAEQVFEAIATEYEIKDAMRKTTKCTSTYTSPDRSPSMSPTTSRKGQYQLSMMNRNKRNVQTSEKFASDPNIHRSLNRNESNRQYTTKHPHPKPMEYLFLRNQNKCSCHNNEHRLNQNTDNQTSCGNVPQIRIEDTEKENNNCAKSCHNIVQHKLVANLRQACSLADLQNTAMAACSLSKSLNNISLGNQCCGNSNSLDNFQPITTNDSPVYVVATPPPIYVLACEHSNNYH